MYKITGSSPVVPTKKEQSNLLFLFFDNIRENRAKTWFCPYILWLNLKEDKDAG